MSAEASFSPSLPSRWRRFSSMMYEGVLLFGLVFGVLLVFDFLTQSRHALMLRDARQVILFMAIGLYFLLSWRRSGQTLPMKTWSLRLVTADGHKLSWPRALYRYVLMWILPLIYALGVQVLSSYTGYSSTHLLIVFAPLTLFIWTWFDAEQLFLHDRIAGTRIVDIRPHLKT